MEKTNDIHFFMDVSGVLQNKEYRERIANQVLVYCKKSQEESAKQLLNIYNSIPIDGFRMGKAPDNLIFNEFLHFEKMKVGILILIFSLWKKANQDLSEVVSAHINEVKKDRRTQIIEKLKQKKSNNEVDEIIDGFKKKAS